jgi:hypothetical protein
MITPERWLAAAAALVCVALLGRLLLGERLRRRLDERWQRLWKRRKAVSLDVRQWKQRAAARREAERAAREAIERAKRGEVERRGNVYTPKAFSRNRKPD